MFKCNGKCSKHTADASDCALALYHLKANSWTELQVNTAQELGCPLTTKVVPQRVLFMGGKQYPQSQRYCFSTLFECICYLPPPPPALQSLLNQALKLRGLPLIIWGRGLDFCDQIFFYFLCSVFFLSLFFFPVAPKNFFFQCGKRPPPPPHRING